MGQWAPGCPQGVNPIRGSKWAAPSVGTPFIVFQKCKKSTQLYFKHMTKWCVCVFQLPGKHKCSTDNDCEGGGYKRTGNGKSWQLDSVWPPQSSLGLSASGLNLAWTSFWKPDFRKCRGEGEGGLMLETLFAEWVVACGAAVHTHT